CQQCNSLPYSV
nr:immunoglobulin light chain junction region [Macaca mulatta]MPO00549.1 immunoglobulin light chain junction region [Macaca mulatta]MPO01431.1 immunoglobulin light chain junction region [Macaca mulatta]